MILYTINRKDAFFDLGNGYLLYVASVEDVKKATPAELQDMVDKAIIVAQYKEIEKTVNLTVH